MKTWKKVSLGTAAAATALLLAACGNSSASKNPTIALPTDPVTLDAGVNTSTYSSILIGNTQEGLMRIGSNHLPELDAAKSVDVSADGLTYTIKLRDGLKWADGTTLNAHDFVYAWQRADAPATASQYAYLMANIKNAPEINSGKIKDLNQLGVKATDDNTLVVTLSKPTPYFKFLLTENVYAPVQKAAVEKYGKQYGTSSDKYVASGPFMFKKGAGWTGTNANFSLVKNPNYWDKKDVKSDEIDIQVVKNPNTAVQLFKQGKLDQASLGTTDLYNANKNYNGGKDLVNLQEATTAYIEYNQSGKNTSSPAVAKALQNKDIREALNLATNRKDIVQQFVPGSTPATGFTPAGMAKTSTGEDFAKYAAQDYTYDAAKAKELWQKGLEEIGESKITFNYETDADTPVSKSIADYLQTSLSKNLPGLTLNEKIVPYAQRLKDSQNGNFDLVMSLWGGDYAEPSTFVNLFMDGSGFNDGQFQNPAYQAAVQKAITTPDVNNDAARNADYKAAEAALYNESSINPVYFRTTPALRNPNLKGLQFNSTGVQYDFKSTYIAK